MGLPKTKKEGGKGKDQFDFCLENSECRGPEYKGGCCMFNEFLEGDPERLDQMTKDYMEKS